MSLKLQISLFGEHNSDEFPLEQIIDFMKDKDVCYRDWSSQITCEYCNSKGLEYFREEEIYYNKDSGFNEVEVDSDDMCYDFAIYRCPICGKWNTYIE